MPFPVDGSVSLEYGCTVSVSQVTASVVQVRRPPFMPAAASVRRYSRKQVHAREIPRRALCDSDQWVAATPFLSPVGSYSHDTKEPPPPQTPVLVALAAQSDAHTRLTHHTQLCRRGKITFGTKEVHQDTVVRHRRYDNCDISSRGGGAALHSPTHALQYQRIRDLQFVTHGRQKLCEDNTCSARRLTNRTIPPAAARLPYTRQLSSPCSKIPAQSSQRNVLQIVRRVPCEIGATGTEERP